VVLSNSASMQGARVDSTALSIGGKELRESCAEVIRNKGGNDVFFAIRDDKKVMHTSSIEVVLPSRTWVNSWLGTSGTRGAFFSVSVPRFGFQCVRLSLLV